MDNQESIYRKSSLERIQSPDQLDQYLKVTTPLVWVLLAAILLLLVAGFVWSSQTVIASRVEAVGTVEDGTMSIPLRDENVRKVVKEGMTIQAGGITGEISSLITGADGVLRAVAPISLPNGSYDVQISYKNTQLISLLFN